MATEKKKFSKKKKVVISILSIVGIIILSSGLWAWNIWKNIYEPIDKETEETEEVTYDIVDGVTNVLLLGTDGRNLEENSRSDSMIIATLDGNKNEIRLTSLFRDTLVNIPGHGEAKLNAAYAYGGHELLMETIEDNFGIKLDKYATINFWGFEKVIDQIGGIEVDVKESEINELNKFIGESTGGATSPNITEAGIQKLDGQQALSYARIRKNDTVYNRDSRQRTVLFKVAEKLKDVNPVKYPFLLNAMKDEIKTNVTPDLIFNMGYTIYKFPELNIKQLAIPLMDEKTGESAFEGRLYKNLGWVILSDLNQMGKFMNQFIYEGITPTLNDVDNNELKSVLAEFKADENSYNAKHGINPEDHATDEDKEKSNVKATQNENQQKLNNKTQPSDKETQGTQETQKDQGNQETTGNQEGSGNQGDSGSQNEQENQGSSGNQNEQEKPVTPEKPPENPTEQPETKSEQP